MLKSFLFNVWYTQKTSQHRILHKREHRRVYKEHKNGWEKHITKFIYLKNLNNHES